MRQGVFSLFSLAIMSASFALQGGDRPEVSICQPSDSQAVEDPISQHIQSSRMRVARLSHNDATVLKNYDLLVQELEAAFRKEKSLKADEMHLIFSAIEFAAEKHHLQLRKNKEKTPYISHPLGVTYNLIHYGQIKDAAVIMGALLHDTLEETKTSVEEIEKAFGKNVASYVQELTEDKSVESIERRRLQVINASKLSKGAAQINLADKLYNVLDLSVNPPEEWSRRRVDRYYQWAQSVIDRLPEVNAALKRETQKVINAYWEGQKKSEKSNLAKS